MSDEPRFLCPCCGTGWDKGLSCPKCRRRILGRVDMQRMNLPEDLWRSRLPLVSEAAQKPTKNYLRNIHSAMATGAGLIVHGSKGVGKSAIAAIVAKEARSRGYTALFVRVWELREMIRSRMGYDADSSMAERVREVEVLVLDDMRREDADEKFFTLSEIHQLVKYRASRRRVTIVTTRLQVELLNKSPMDALSEILLLFPVEGPNLYDERKRDLEQTLLGT